MLSYLSHERAGTMNPICLKYLKSQILTRISLYIFKLDFGEYTTVIYYETVCHGKRKFQHMFTSTVQPMSGKESKLMST